jgi:hypothetical protein
MSTDTRELYLVKDADESLYVIAEGMAAAVAAWHHGALRRLQRDFPDEDWTLEKMVEEAVVPIEVQLVAKREELLFLDATPDPGLVAKLLEWVEPLATAAAGEDDVGRKVKEALVAVMGDYYLPSLRALLARLRKQLPVEAAACEAVPEEGG